MYFTHFCIEFESNRVVKCMLCGDAAVSVIVYHVQELKKEVHETCL